MAEIGDVSRRDLLGLAAGGAVGVAMTSHPARAHADPAVASDVPDFGERPIVIGEQRTNTVLVLDQHAEDWNDDAAVRWRWPVPAAWGAPGDICRRTCSRLGGDVMLITTLKQVAVVRLDNLKISWQVSFPAGVNSHTAEILPNGFVAVAGTGGDWIRVYNPRSSRLDPVYAEVALEDSHGLQWDPGTGLLWALGKFTLIGLSVRSTRGVPRLAVEHTAMLPDLDDDGHQGPGDYLVGHDLTASRADSDVLWVTANPGVLQYSLSTDSFSDSYPGHEVINVPRVKGIGDWPDGQVVFNHQTPGSLHPWTTDTVRFYNPTFTRTRTSAAFYKARPFIA